MLKRWLDRRWYWPRRETLIQAVVWTASAGLCVLLLAGHTRAPQLVGLARGRIAQLSVPWPARVESVPVELFQKVARGDVVALLDDRVFQAQIEQAQAEIARLRSEHEQAQQLLDTEFDDREAGWRADNRSFVQDAADLSIRLHEVRADVEYDRALLEGLQAQATGLSKLVDRGHAPLTELDLAQAEAAATARRLEENERLAADLARRLSEAESLRERHGGHEPVAPRRDPAAQQLMQAIAVQLGLLGELQAQRDQCILRAPFDGTVVAIQGQARDPARQRPGEGDIRRTGEVVRAGEAVVVVAADRAREVVAYALEGSTDRPQPGLEVILTWQGASSQLVRSTIASVGPSVEQLPEQLWNMQTPVWGRPFLIPIPSGFDVVAGDRIGVRFD